MFWHYLLLLSKQLVTYSSIGGSEAEKRELPSVLYLPDIPASGFHCLKTNLILLALGNGKYKCKGPGSFINLDFLNNSLK